MRTIKFRGKRVDNGEWVYGYYYTNNLGLQHMIKVDSQDLIGNLEVHPETVGQFTGLHDKDGNEIYEHDHFGNPEFMVLFSNGMFTLGQLPLVGYLNGQYMEHVHNIKGNIHDNLKKAGCLLIKFQKN